MKYEVKEIRIHNILIDHLPINPQTLEYAKRIKRGSHPPPIRVAKRGKGQFEIRDGRHRLAAHLLTGRDKILAKFKNSVLKEEYKKSEDEWFRKGLSKVFQ